MATENLSKRSLKLKYSITADGKDKSVSQSFSNIKLTSTTNELYSIGNSLKSLIDAPSVDIEKNDSFDLVE